MKRFALLQGSLNPESKTFYLLKEIERVLEQRGHSIVFMDLREISLEFCDGRPLNEYNESLQYAYNHLEKVDAVIIGMPVYQYSVSGPLKNFFDITAGAIKDKLVGIALVSGGVRAYMAAMDLFNLLALEVNTTSVMPIIHASGDDIKKNKIMNLKIHDKINELIDKIERLLCIS